MCNVRLARRYRAQGGGKMDGVLAKLDVAIRELESKSVNFPLKGSPGELTEVLEHLIQGRTHLLEARMRFKQARTIMQKGYGRLVELGE